LDRSVFGALKAAYRAVYRMDMPQQDSKRITKADFAAYLILAWEPASDHAIHRCWERYEPDTKAHEEAIAGGRRSVIPTLSLRGC
jgi:hypothetical protein